MEDYKMTQEQESQKVEEACEANYDLKFDEQDCFISILVRLDRRSRSRCQMIDHDSVCDIVH